MTQRSSRIVAAQAVVVGVLTVVVFVTLLRPEGDSPLVGIAGPAGTPPSTQPSPGSYDDHGDHGSGAGPGRPQQSGGPIQVAAGAPVATTTLAPGPSGTPSEPAPGDAGDQGTPADDQYADTLTRLFARLN